MLLNRLWKRLQRPEEIHTEIADEFQFHIDMKAAELVERGMPEKQARHEAARQFGPPLRLHELGYDVRGGGWMEEIWNDTRFALRILRKDPMKTGLLIATLALGIGLNTSVFSVVKSVLLEPLPFDASARLVSLHQANQVQSGGVSYPHYLDWREAHNSFTGMAVYSATSAILTEGEQASRLYGATVSASLFPLLGIQPVRGRLFTDAEDKWDGSRPLLISDRLWRSHFEGRPDILGKPVVLDSKTFRVIGVIPARLAFPVQSDPMDYWTTVAVDADPGLYGGSIPTSRGYPRYDAVLARLAPGVELQKAQAEMNVLAARIQKAHPRSTSMNDVRVNRALEDLVGPVRPMLLLLYGGVFCVLLVACANAATLLLVGATARQKEFALRAALGARAGRLVRQLLLESLVVALAGCAAGIGVAWALVAVFVRIAPADTPRLATATLDATVLLYAVLVSAGTGLFFGLLPAIRATRIDLLTRLKEGARSVAGGSRTLRPGTLLICGQIALSMALTCSAVLLAASFLKTVRSPKGFDPHSLLTASLSLPVQRYPQQSRKVVQFYDALLERVREVPGVEAASAAQSLPLSGQNNGTTVEIVGHPRRGLPGASLRFVEPEYFRTLRIPLTSGRLFSRQDRWDRPPCVVVNRAFVRRFLQGQDPLTAQVQLGWGGDRPKQIIGVIGDIRHDALSQSADPEVYVPLAQFPINDMSLVVRTTADPQAMAAAIRKQAANLDASIPLEQIRTLDAYLLLSVAPQRFLMWVLIALAGSALLLAAIGLYGALSYSTRCRNQEFGIRMALGSTASGLLTLVIRQGLGIAVAGMAGGMVLTAFVSSLLARWLFQTSPTDPLSLACAGGILLTIALLACWGPARRAARVSPLTSLRAE